MTKFVFAILILLIASGVLIARGQQTTAGFLSDNDKADIIETVLDLELKAQASITDFANIRNLSSDNIEFIEPSRLSKRGFTLMTGSELRESEKDRVVEYLLFRRIYLRDGAVVVVLSRVIEGRPCFGAPLSRQQNYTYECRRRSEGWTAQLIGRPGPLISFWPKRSVTKR